ncbi:flavin-dependent oxidoreductase F420-dependent methylene-tetrahydromethanopterin reductase [Cellulomonas chitinilytica]|uniref:Flavin-dependent oxidoreductase F420-dependent methylene-tetrahydromethanopterin reductase n=1 Tax=Cellulomonas chitinilytica TaxID=398759 RepID=A0A919U1E6_9CELL|nr:NtaA/DmoA family FMN-dependent monooxygenase [Cellulomonas chitinilytica]GIG20079.1 flavin-dependent oxidoreductase F420-dependent methylene-tetrahydromethanopterin reductase [Cellulomonas chitinilytica]
MPDTPDVPRPHAHVHLGVFFQGVNHTTIWSDPASGSQTDFETFRRVAQTAERGLFDAFFLGEGLRLREQNGRLHDLDVVGRPDAITQLAALAAVTTHIGLVATQNVTYNDPADLARRLASLDVLSGGRAAWNIVTTDNAWTGENFRRGGWLDHSQRYTRAAEFVRAVQAIWDGWDAPEPVRATGGTLDIEVTPTVPRTAQGHPVLFQAGDSPDGRDFAAGHAEVIFSAHGTDFDDALAFATDVRARTVAAGRPEDDLKILPGTQFVLAATDAEARDKARWVKEQQVTPATALSLLGQVWGEDLSHYDPDGPLPAHDPVIEVIGETRGSPRRGKRPHEIAQAWRARAEAEHLTIRQLVIAQERERGFVGSPSTVADELVRWVRHGASDGFNITPWLVPSGLDDVVDLLVPALQERGAYRTAYTGTTLREHLGLRAPLTHRVAAAAQV